MLIWVKELITLPILISLNSPKTPDLVIDHYINCYSCSVILRTWFGDKAKKSTLSQKRLEDLHLTSLIARIWIKSQTTTLKIKQNINKMSISHHREVPSFVRRLDRLINDINGFIFRLPKKTRATWRVQWRSDGRVLNHVHREPKDKYAS